MKLSNLNQSCQAKHSYKSSFCSKYMTQENLARFKEELLNVLYR